MAEALEKKYVDGLEERIALTQKLQEAAVEKRVLGVQLGQWQDAYRQLETQLRETQTRLLEASRKLVEHQAARHVEPVGVGVAGKDADTQTEDSGLTCELVIAMPPALKRMRTVSLPDSSVSHALDAVSVTETAGPAVASDKHLKQAPAITPSSTAQISASQTTSLMQSISSLIAPHVLTKGAGFSKVYLCKYCQSEYRNRSKSVWIKHLSECSLAPKSLRQQFDDLRVAKKPESSVQPTKMARNASVKSISNNTAMAIETLPTADPSPELALRTMLTQTSPKRKKKQQAHEKEKKDSGSVDAPISAPTGRTTETTSEATGSMSTAQPHFVSPPAHIVDPHVRKTGVGATHQVSCVYCFVVWKDMHRERWAQHLAACTKAPKSVRVALAAYGEMSLCTPRDSGDEQDDDVDVGPLKLASERTMKSGCETGKMDEGDGTGERDTRRLSRELRSSNVNSRRSSITSSSSNQNNHSAKASRVEGKDLSLEDRSLSTHFRRQSQSGSGSNSAKQLPLLKSMVQCVHCSLEMHGAFMARHLGKECTRAPQAIQALKEFVVGDGGSRDRLVACGLLDDEEDEDKDDAKEMGDGEDSDDLDSQHGVPLLANGKGKPTVRIPQVTTQTARNRLSVNYTDADEEDEGRE